MNKLKALCAAVLMLPIVIFGTFLVSSKMESRADDGVFYAPFGFYSDSHTIVDEPGKRYTGGMLWEKQTDGTWKLLHGFIRDYMSAGGLVVCGDPQLSEVNSQPRTLSATLHNSTVLMLTSGLYINNVRMETNDRARVFVIGRDRTVTPVELTDEELKLIQPDTYPDAFGKSDLWALKFRPLVDPDLIKRMKRDADLDQEKNEIYERASLGLKLSREHVTFGDGDQSVGEVCSDWLSLSDGTDSLENAFITCGYIFFDCYHQSKYDKRFYPEWSQRIQPGSHETFVEAFPFHYEINGEKVERGQIYVQHADGKIAILELTPEDRKLFTKELLSDRQRFYASDLYQQKIAPLLHERVLKEFEPPPPELEAEAPEKVPPGTPVVP